MAAAQPNTGEVLFFIPDIGGFTKFVAETEIRHSQHIIKELLEILVDSNTLGLEVSEFEGDAVLFFRGGSPPSLAALVEQARAMFVAFHRHLKRIEVYRVCQCGACTGASRISLKIVAHAGVSSTMQVKDHRKFIGKDVIVAHRLLKNTVPDREYLLVTEATLAKLAAAEEQLSAFVAGTTAYDELGDIEYRYKSLASYLGEVDVEPPSPFTLKNPVKVMSLSQHIDAPAEAVYQVLIDLPARMKWIEGIKALEFRDQQSNHIGKVHRCVRDGNDPEVVTSDVKIGPNSMELWETDLKKMGACKYLVTKAPGNATEMALEFFVRGNPIVRLVFKALMERKLRSGFEKSLRNLAALCEGAAQPTALASNAASPNSRIEVRPSSADA
jgi:uncharacterized membrane protein